MQNANQLKEMLASPVYIFVYDAILTDYGLVFKSLVL